MCMFVYVSVYFLSLSLSLNLPFSVKEIFQYDSILNLEIPMLFRHIRVTKTYIRGFNEIPL